MRDDGGWDECWYTRPGLNLHASFSQPDARILIRVKRSEGDDAAKTRTEIQAVAMGLRHDVAGVHSKGCEGKHWRDEILVVMKHEPQRLLVVAVQSRKELPNNG